MNAHDTNPIGQPRHPGDFDPELSEAEFTAQFWGRVLERRPYFDDVLRCQAEALAKAGRYAELVELDQRLLELHPSDPVITYNLACTLARLGQLSESLAMLRKALKLGYVDFAHIETDPDLEAVRELPEYAKLLKQKSAKKKR